MLPQNTTINGSTGLLTQGEEWQRGGAHSALTTISAHLRCLRYLLSLLCQKTLTIPKYVSILDIFDTCAPFDPDDAFDVRAPYIYIE
ncbi:hypothetical protein V22_28870 [Calycomorphotria hydatis]|uniref:Uncharacterized protein n=1 Tax=Calycomorphotria hydatis TaxID=2528027 RepID=A0A517TB79_9PLAN|nr:hypothetical protein V22_28870 [Calycomorphotria hydatis]